MLLSGYSVKHAVGGTTVAMWVFTIIRLKKMILGSCVLTASPQSTNSQPLYCIDSIVYLHPYNYTVLHTDCSPFITNSMQTVHPS